MKNVIIVSIALLLAGALGCNSKQGGQSTASDEIFLTGRWVLPGAGEEDKIFVEDWALISDTSFSGQAYIENTVTGDRFNTERLLLNFSENIWILTAEPAGQTPVDFTCTTQDKDLLIFENPEHDFPQFIEYKRITTDSLMVSIGDTSTRNSWPLVRIP